MHRTLVPLLLLIVSLPLPVGAQSAPPVTSPPDDAAPAQRYAHGSFSLGGGAGTFFSSAPPARETQFGATAIGRWVSRVGLAVTATFDAGAWFGQLSAGGTTQNINGISLGGSLGAGWAFALAPNLAITPEVYAAGGYNVTSGTVGMLPPNTAFVAGAEIPFEVFVSRHVAIEPALFGDFDLQNAGQFMVGSSVRVMFPL